MLCAGPDFRFIMLKKGTVELASEKPLVVTTGSNESNLTLLSLDMYTYKHYIGAKVLMSLYQSITDQHLSLVFCSLPQERLLHNPQACVSAQHQLL